MLPRAKKAPAAPTPPVPAPNGAASSAPTPNGAGSDGDVSWSWQYRHSSGVFGVLCIAKGKDAEDYFVQHVATRVYHLTRLTPGETVTYTVAARKTEGRCTCPGGKRGSCKHLTAMSALVKGGTL